MIDASGLQMVLGVLTGWLDRRERETVAYLIEENRSLRRRLKTRRLRLTDAIAAGGSTLRDFLHPQGEKGSFQQVFAVYDREGEKCPRRRCGGTIKRIVQSGRSTFYCPRCQK